MTLRFLSLLLLLALACSDGAGTATPEYTPDHESLRSHPLPAWYSDAKLGILIHWGPYSVPGWASHEFEPLENLLNPEYWRANPYAEWYQNTLRIDGSATETYHEETWGAEVDYDDFGSMFAAESAAWDPSDWATLFESAGARYLVLVTKHHDGYLLWPSEVTAPGQDNWQSERDLVGELAQAVRARGMRMGLYYSGGLDWTFTEEPITNVTGLLTSPEAPEYVDYVDDHFRDLVARYEPDVLWNDIGTPSGFDRFELFADYYNRVPEGVINDRWGQTVQERAQASSPTEASAIEALKTTQFDFYTSEYGDIALSELKFELVRAVGNSFGYNRADAELEAPVLTPLDAIEILVDVVSKNGNLNLGVGPRADGSIPEEQLAVLEGLADWMRVNGEAVHGTRPWTRAEGEGRAPSGAEPTIRFTTTRNSSDEVTQLFAFIYGLGASERSVTIDDVPEGWTDVRRLDGASVSASTGSDAVTLMGDADFPADAVTVIAFRYR